jgi:hypothetical protein
MVDPHQGGLDCNHLLKDYQDLLMELYQFHILLAFTHLNHPNL